MSEDNKKTEWGYIIAVGIAVIGFSIGVKVGNSGPSYSDGVHDGLALFEMLRPEK